MRKLRHRHVCMLSKVTQLLCGGIPWGQKSLLNLQKLESRRQGPRHGAWDLRKVPEGEEFYRGCTSSATSYSYISLALAGSQDQPRSSHSGQGMGWSRPRPCASCLRVEDHLTQNRNTESTEEIVPKGKPESGTERGDGVGLGGSVHHRSPRSWRLRVWSPSRQHGPHGLGRQHLRPHPDPLHQSLYLKKIPG